MKLIFRLSAFILLATMLLSCDDDNIEQKLDPGIEITDELVVGPKDGSLQRAVSETRIHSHGGPGKPEHGFA